MNPIQLDLRGLKCPFPALRLRKALKGAAAGTVFMVECTDPMAAIDLPNLIRETGDAIEDSRSEGELIVFQIRKAAPNGPGAGSDQAALQSDRRVL